MGEDSVLRQAINEVKGKAFELMEDKIEVKHERNMFDWNALYKEALPSQNISLGIDGYIDDIIKIALQELISENIVKDEGYGRISLVT
jgi:hypothetical protein